uniref:Receptor-like cytoplasmic kinase 176 n=1 Tax=Tanacetum cinerariifolium TaxID=118510 RepID=A0A699HEF2_TANCI|nr:receptor-like cytoplasmic kinase 176 [Tanacetum cinerariifolium]
MGTVTSPHELGVPMDMLLLNVLTQCNQQEVDSNAGYYVMRWMYDFVITHQIHFPKTIPWTSRHHLVEKDIDRTVEQWHMMWRRCIDKKLPPGEQMPLEFAKSYLKKERWVLKIIDSEINGQYSSDVAIRASELAMKCLLDEPMHRPTAAELVKELEQLQVQKPV